MKTTFRSFLLLLLVEFSAFLVVEFVRVGKSASIVFYVDDTLITISISINTISISISSLVPSVEVQAMPRSKSQCGLGVRCSKSTTTRTTMDFLHVIL